MIRTYRYLSVVLITAVFLLIRTGRCRREGRRRRCECLRKGPDFFPQHVALRASVTAEAAACYFAGRGEREWFPQARVKTRPGKWHVKCIGSAANKRDQYESRDGHCQPIRRYRARASHDTEQTRFYRDDLILSRRRVSRLSYLARYSRGKYRRIASPRIPRGFKISDENYKRFDIYIWDLLRIIMCITLSILVRTRY